MRQLSDFIGDFNYEIESKAWRTVSENLMFSHSKRKELHLHAQKAFQRWPLSEITCLKGTLVKPTATTTTNASCYCGEKYSTDKHQSHFSFILTVPFKKHPYSCLTRFSSHSSFINLQT